MIAKSSEKIFKLWKILTQELEDIQEINDLEKSNNLEEMIAELQFALNTGAIKNQRSEIGHWLAGYPSSIFDKYYEI